MSQDLQKDTSNPPPEPWAPTGNGALDATIRMVRKIVVLVAGLTVVLVGIIMIVAPGPAFIVIPLGLAILATEFLWAAKILKRLKEGATSFREILFGRLFKKPAGPPAASAEASPNVNDRRPVRSDSA